MKVKVGFHYPSSRAEFTARELGCIFWHPSTRAVNSSTRHCRNSRTACWLETISRATKTDMDSNCWKRSETCQHWSAHRVAASARSCWLEELREDSNAPLGGMLLMMMTMCFWVFYWLTFNYCYVNEHRDLLYCHVRFAGRWVPWLWLKQRRSSDQTAPPISQTYTRNLSIHQSINIPESTSAKKLMGLVYRTRPETTEVHDSRRPLDHPPSYSQCGCSFILAVPIS